MDETEHGHYSQFFDWKNMDGDKTNIYGRLREYFCPVSKLLNNGLLFKGTKQVHVQFTSKIVKCQMRLIIQRVYYTV